MKLKTAASNLYSDVDRLSGGQFINVEALQFAAEDVATKAAKGLGARDTARITKRILDLPPEIPFEDAQILRSDLLGVGRTGTELVKGKAQGAAKLLAGEMDKAIADSALGLTGDALAAFRQANSFWKRGKEKFNSTFIKSLVKRDPEMAYDVAVKNNRPTAIKKLRQIVGSKRDWEVVQRQFLDDWVAGSVDVKTGEASGVAMLRKLKQMGASLDELFPEEVTRGKIRSLAKTVQLAQSRPQFQNLSMGIRIAQAGIIFGAAAGAIPRGAAAIVFGPEVIAFALKSKTGFKWLTKGFRAPPGSAASATAFTKFVTLMNRDLVTGGQSQEPLPQVLF